MRVPRFPGRRPITLRATGALLAAAALVAVSGCGSSNERFTSGEASRALAALDQIQSYIDTGRCAAAQRRVNTLAVQATHINRDRPQLGDAYAGGVARLQTLVDRECVEIEPSAPTAEVTAPAGPTPREQKPQAQPTDGGTKPPTDGGNDGGQSPGQSPGQQPPDSGQNPGGNSGGAAPGA